MNGGSKPTLVAGGRPCLDRLTQLREAEGKGEDYGFLGRKATRRKEQATSRRAASDPSNG
jgi:hypothetical protein